MVLCHETQKLPSGWRAEDPTGSKSRKSLNHYPLTDNSYLYVSRAAKKRSADTGCFGRLHTHRKVQSNTSGLDLI